MIPIKETEINFKFLILTLILSLFILNPYFAFTQLEKENSCLVELPNAGLYNKGTTTLRTDFFSLGALRFSLNLCPFQNTMVTFSTLLHDIDNFHLKYLALYFKYRIVEESVGFPAVAVGLASSNFASKPNRYYPLENWAPGIILVGSKAFSNFIGIFDIHFGLNYSFEIEDSNNSLLIYSGLSQQFFKIARTNLEFSICYDERTTGGLKNKGFLNFSVDFLVSSNMKIGVAYRDLLGNLDLQRGIKRFILIEYALR